MDVAEIMVVTCNDSTLGNIGLDHVAKTSWCQIVLPTPGEALGGGGCWNCRSARRHWASCVVRCCPHPQPNARCLCPQRSARSWRSSSNAWSSNPSPGCSCCRTCRSSSGGRRRSSSSTPAAWRSWPSASPPRSAAPGSTSSSEKGPGLRALGGRAGVGGRRAAKQKGGEDALEADGLRVRPWVCRVTPPRLHLPECNGGEQSFLRMRRL